MILISVQVTEDTSGVVILAGVQKIKDSESLSCMIEENTVTIVDSSQTYKKAMISLPSCPTGSWKDVACSATFIKKKGLLKVTILRIAATSVTSVASDQITWPALTKLTSIPTAEVASNLALNSSPDTSKSFQDEVSEASGIIPKVTAATLEVNRTSPSKLDDRIVLEHKRIQWEMPLYASERPTRAHEKLFDRASKCMNIQSIQVSRPLKVDYHCSFNSHILQQLSDAVIGWTESPTAAAACSLAQACSTVKQLEDAFEMANLLAVAFIKVSVSPSQGSVGVNMNACYAGYRCTEGVSGIVR
jgi:hypothetical protein